MNVPFLDVAATYTSIRQEVDEAVQQVLDGGYYIMGSSCQAFENEFSAYVGATETVGMGNGLDALHLALRAAGVAPGDEVIVPAHTFIATWLAVTYTGATPVPVDVDPVTRNIDPARIEAARTSHTKAVMPVHLYGRPADMNGVLAASNGLFVLEDAAQAHGATYNGKSAGSFGDAAGFSFYPGKNLGAFGDGGAATTNRHDIAESMRRLRNYGSAQKYRHDVAGYNSRLDELQAAVLSVKLRHLTTWNGRRRAIARRYLEALQGLPNLQLPPPDDATYSSAWHLFVVEHPERDALAERLRSNGVQTNIHYPIACHLSGAYAHLGLQRGTFPVAERLADQVLSLPIGPHLSDDQVSRVVEAVRMAVLAG